jgi:hypothetical protein
VLVEVDAQTGFSDNLVRAGRKRLPAELKRNPMYVIIGAATNMGLSLPARRIAIGTKPVGPATPAAPEP